MQYRSTSFISTLFGSIASLFLCAITISSHAEYENNGNSIYPIWSELSYFERSTIADLAKAEKNDSDALLALYLLASGVRELDVFNTANKKIHSFVKKTQNSIRDPDNQQLSGEILTKEMHNSFFSKGDNHSTLSGYSADQSGLLGIFETGSFNCISSSLLYIVLARHFDLDVEGVLLPSHAFVQLNIKGGPKLDVETTSPDGFNQKHDENFYAKQNNEWFSSRNLETSKYEDYLNRNIVSPTVLAAANMLNQHTGPKMMDLEDSGRLAEISAFIDPSGVLGNEKRMYFYGMQINQMIRSQSWNALLRFYRITYDRIMKDSAQFRQSESLQNNLRLYLSGAMLTYANDGNIEQTLTVMGELISRGLSSSEHQVEIESRVINAVQILLTKLSEQHRFQEGLLALTLIEGHLSNPSAWPDLLSWFYMSWAKQAWDRKEWQEVVEILNEYLSTPNQNLNRSIAYKTLKDTYTNWVSDLLNNKDIDGAVATLEKCMNETNSSVCYEAKIRIEKYKPRFKIY